MEKSLVDGEPSSVPLLENTGSSNIYETSQRQRIKSKSYSPKDFSKCCENSSHHVKSQYNSSQGKHSGDTCHPLQNEETFETRYFCSTKTTGLVLNPLYKAVPSPAGITYEESGVYIIDELELFIPSMISRGTQTEQQNVTHFQEETRLCPLHQRASTSNNVRDLQMFTTALTPNDLVVKEGECDKLDLHGTNASSCTNSLPVPETGSIYRQDFVAQQESFNRHTIQEYSRSNGKRSSSSAEETIDSYPFESRSFSSANIFLTVSTDSSVSLSAEESGLPNPITDSINEVIKNMSNDELSSLCVSMPDLNTNNCNIDPSILSSVSTPLTIPTEESVESVPCERPLLSADELSTISTSDIMDSFSTTRFIAPMQEATSSKPLALLYEREHFVTKAVQSIQLTKKDSDPSECNSLCSSIPSSFKESSVWSDPYNNCTCYKKPVGFPTTSTKKTRTKKVDWKNVQANVRDLDIICYRNLIRRKEGEVKNAQRKALAIADLLKVANDSKALQ